MKIKINTKPVKSAVIRTPVPTPANLSKAQLDAQLAFYDGPDKVISSTEMRELLKNQNKSQYSFPTGLLRLDAAIENVESGELIAIGGPTKHGKTLLAQTITANMCKSGVGVLWFTFEVPPKQFLNQVADDFVFYMPKVLEPHKFDWMKNRIKESKLKHETRVVFIDNLHHVFDITVSRNASMDIGGIIRGLKRLAIDLNIAIFLLCHSKKPQEINGEVQDASEWDLRDSSFIPQESDTTWMVQRKMDPKTKEFSNKATLKICLNRRTGVMGKKIHLAKEGFVMIEDPETYYAEEK